MALLELQDISFNYSDKELYKSVSMKINNGEHCTLVGVNGSGKTTLLNMIVGQLKPDQGKVLWTNGVTFSYLDQQLKVQQDMPVEAYLYGVWQTLFDEEKQMEALYQKSAEDPDNFEKILAKAQRLQDDLDKNNFYGLQEKVGRLTNGLGFDKSQLQVPLHQLSSGQREKAYLAKMLLEERDVLIMDEPTNFLDQTQVAWLSEYLIAYPKAFLVVSHDQEFLRKIANVVFVLENQTLTRYKGNYDYFLSQHALDKEQYEKNYEAQQRYIKKGRDFHRQAHRARHLVKAAKSHRARLSHLEVLDEPGKEEGRVFLLVPLHPQRRRKTASSRRTFDRLRPSFARSDHLHPPSGRKDRHLRAKRRGQNHLPQDCFRAIPALGGSFKWLEGTAVNYYNQDEKIDLSFTPFAYVHNAYPNFTNTESEAP
jgi:ATPase subunit of ABC transporter with duplicated ATPase domains